MLDNLQNIWREDALELTKYRHILEADAWFGSIEVALRTRILEKIRIRAFGDEGCIYALGEPPDGMYVVLEGEVRLIVYPLSGRPFITRIFRPGDWFGSMAVCDGGPRSNEAVAFERALMGYLSFADIESIAREMPLWREIARLNGREHRFATDFVMAMLGQSPIARLSVLLRLGSAVGEDGVPSIKITQEDLAAVAGLSRQRLNTILHQLEATGRIERGYGTIRILDRRLIRPPSR